MNRRFFLLVALLTLSFAYFLLFAQFAFLKLAEAAGVEDNALRAIMAAMALAGITASWLTPRTLRKLEAIRVARLAFVVAAWTAATAAQVKAFPPLAALTGLSVGMLTVSLAAVARESVPSSRGLWAAAIATGLGYAVCNLPWIFEAKPALQSWMAAIGALLGAGLSCLARGGAANPEPVRKASIQRGAILAAVACFTALVWLDSAAFYIVQQTRELKEATWGAGDLGRNAATHLVAALLAGWLVVRTGWPGAVLLGFSLLGAAALMVGHEPLRRAAGWLYPAGASIYSVALMAWPAFLSGAENGLAASRRAALLYTIAGWLGSAGGIGMAENLRRVPGAFVATAALVILTATLWPVVKRGGKVWLILVLAEFALVMTWDARSSAASPSRSEVDLGRDVYVREGCIHCHSRYSRPETDENLAWGPVSNPGDVAREKPPLIGNRRQGPDLTWVGARRSETWLRLHFLDPRSLAPGSLMPRYAHLFESEDGRRLIAFLRDRQEPALQDRLSAAATWEPRGRASPNGTALFAKHCSACHGATGLGDGKWAREFAKPPTNLRAGPFPWSSSTDGTPLPLALARVIKFGVIGSDMPGHETLTDADVMALAELASSFRRASGP